MKFSPLAVTAAYFMASAVNAQDYLTAGPGSRLNSGKQFESLSTLQERMSMQVPNDPDHFPPNYDPLDDAICFNEDYYTPSVDSYALYNDFAAIFDWGLTVSEDR